MAVTATPIFPQTIKSYGVQILPADTTTVKTLATAGANGSKIDAIIIQSTDTAAQYVTLTVQVGGAGTAFPLGNIIVPITAGSQATGTAPSVDALRAGGTSNVANIPGFSYDSLGNKCLYLSAGSVLGVNTGTTVTTAKAVTVFAQGGDF